MIVRYISQTQILNLQSIRRSEGKLEELYSSRAVLLCLNRTFKLRARKNLRYKKSISLISRVIFSSVDEIIIFS